jgi:hypothetical protein
MNDNISMTRITDLPDATGQMPSDMYAPINAHPNPYGISAPPPGGIPHPSPEGSFNRPLTQNTISEDQIAALRQMPTQRLPQRDIPIETHQYMHDEEIQPNYIPKPKLTSDYIQEYQKTTDRKIESYEKEKRRERNIESWINELYQPIIIGLLYFIFQLPIINRLVFQRFTFLQIYNDDGNFNLWGLGLKGSLFATYYYLVQKSMAVLSEL